MSITALTATRTALIVRLLRARPHRIVDLCTAVGMSTAKQSLQQVRLLVYALVEQGQVRVVDNRFVPQERTYEWVEPQ